MPPLTAHIADPDAHGRLPFHPACPICQQTRLAGSLASGGVLSARAPALLAIGAMAVSTAAPAVSAVAAEPDQEQRGTSTVAPSAVPDPARDPDFDPGGGSTELPALPVQSPPPAAAQQGPPATEPDAEAPSASGTDPVVDTGDGTDPAEAKAPATPAPPGPAATPGASQPVTPATPAPSPPPAPAAATEPTAQPDAVESEQPAATPRERTERTASLRATKAKEPLSQRNAVTPQRVPIPASTVPTAPVAGTATVAAPSSGPPAEPGDRRHTVQSGESLWSIASDLLGGETSSAQIAREVHRLWHLNRARIGTGDPDLLMVGTTLRLQ